MGKLEHIESPVEDLFGKRYRYGLMEIHEEQKHFFFEAPSLSVKIGYMTDPFKFFIVAPVPVCDLAKLEQLLHDLNDFEKEDPLHIKKGL